MLQASSHFWKKDLSIQVPLSVEVGLHFTYVLRFLLILDDLY